MKNSNIEELNLGNIKWLNIINAKKPEIEYLRKNYLFDIGDLGESLSTIESFRSKMKQRKHYLFLILRFPYYDKSKKEIVSEEVDIFINKNTFITIHRKKLSVLTDFFSIIKKEKNNLIKNKSDVMDLFTEFLIAMYNDCYHMMDHITADMDEFEEEMYAGQQQITVKRILRTRMNIINFRRIVIHHKNIIKKIISLKTEYIDGPKHNSHLMGLISATKDIWENIDSLKETIEALNSTNESMISFKLNHIIKILTIFSVTLLVVTLIPITFAVEFHGNFLTNSTMGFLSMLGLMTLSVILIIIIFKKKKWF